MAPPTKIIVPTSINLLTAVNATYLTLNNQGEDLSVVLPSLRRRALLVVKETGVLPVDTAIQSDESFTR